MMDTPDVLTPPAAAPAAIDFDEVIARYAMWSFDDDTPLVQAGLDSLSMLRMVADLETDPDREIGAERLVAIDTVGELKTWLTSLYGPDAGRAGAS
jgi:aryl carrier-like protein